MIQNINLWLIDLDCLILYVLQTFLLLLKQAKIIQQDKNQQDKKMYCLYYQKRKKNCSQKI